jgi:Helicase associated domain
LSGEQILQLASLPGWTWNEHESTWDTAFILLTRYAKRKGDALVPTAYEEEGVRLGEWVADQRDRLRRGKLDDARANRLARVPGWTWRPAQSQWDRGVDHLRSFIERDGTALVPQGVVSGDGSGRGAWVARQQLQHRQGVLDPNREARLEALPGWTWAPSNDRQDRWIEALNQFAQREGHARVPTHHVEGGPRSGSLGQYTASYASRP